MFSETPHFSGCRSISRRSLASALHVLPISVGTNRLSNRQFRHRNTLPYVVGNKSATHRRARPHRLAAGVEYGWRALVEADIARWKYVIGGGLRLQTNGRQATEVAIAADVLNRMLEPGRPEYIRIA